MVVNLDHVEKWGFRLVNAPWHWHESGGPNCKCQPLSESRPARRPGVRGGQTGPGPGGPDQ